MFTHLITKGSLTVEGQTLTSALLWCLQCLKLRSNEISILKCMQILAKGNCIEIEQENFPCLNDIQNLSDNFSFKLGSEELSLNCLRYVEALTFLPNFENERLSKQNILRFFDIFKKILFDGNKYFCKDEVIYCKFLITAMRGISNLIQMSDDIIINNLGELLGIIKKYMLYGLSGQENYEIQKLFPTSTSIPEVLKPSIQPVQKIRGKYDKISKKITVTSLNDVEVDDTKSSSDYLIPSDYDKNDSYLRYKTSDSDLSDYETFQTSKITSFKSRTRHCALILLATVVQKTSPKIFIGYMPYFLPDGSQFQHMRTLLTCVLSDPCSKCRCEAVGILSMIIFNCKQYFLLADGLSKSSFTTFSCTIANIIKELHKCLFNSLETEKNNANIKRLLKCISDLIRCTPYHKVDPSLIKTIAQQTKPFLTHKDVNIQIFALSVFGCIISVEPKFKELNEIIISNVKNNSTIESSTVSLDDEIIDDYDIDNDEEFKISQEQKPWLLNQCLQNLMEKNNIHDTVTNVALQVESLHVIGALARNYFTETIVSYPDDIVNLLK